jgi:hypothetical protein
LANGTLEEVHDVEFDETQGSQSEAQNHDDVRGDQLANATKNMDIGDIRPRQVDDDGGIHMSQEVQADTNQTSTSGTQDEAQVQDQDQASGSNQLQVLQPSNIARDHPLDHIIGDIQRGVQTRSRLVAICEHYSFVSFEEPTKIQDALNDADWVNAMHEELNNFTRN